MKLLITGGAGFIGSNFIHYIFHKYPDYQVVNLDWLTYAGNLENLQAVENKPNYKFVRGDIADRDLVNDLVKDVDIIVNFAADTHVDRSVMDSAAFIHTNIIGTHNLLEVAKNNGQKRFHHISTDEVYGSLSPAGTAFNENTKYRPRNPYSASKAGSDHLVLSYFHTHQLPVTISNCSNNYGPYQFPEKLHGLFITNLLEDKPVPIYGDGLQIRDWLYVEDHCRAIDQIIHNGRIGQTYCVGGGCEKTNLAVAKEILKLLNKEERLLEFVQDRPGHDRRYAMDYSKIKNELGWEPSVDFSQGLAKTITWYENNEAWWRRCKSGQYQEYYQKQYGR